MINCENKFWPKIKDKVESLIKGGFFYILSGNVLNKAIAMISSIVIARLLTKNEYAYLAYADNLYSYIALLDGLGLSTAILIYCGKDHNLQRDRAYLDFALIVGSAFECIVSFVLCVIINYIDIPYPQAKFYIISLAFYPFLSYVYTTFSCYLRTQYENKKYAMAGMLSSGTTCVFSITLLLLFGAKGIIAARYLAIVVVLVYLGLFIRTKFTKIKRVILDSHVKMEFVKIAISMMIANVFSAMMPINETFLVNNIIQDEISVANFKIAGLLPQLLYLVAGAITVYYFPIVAQMKKWKDIRQKVYKIGVFTFFVILGISFIGILFTPLTIKLLYGEKYLDAVSISYLLWIMRAMNCCIRMVPVNMLPAVGKTTFNMWMAFVSCLFQTLIDYYLILHYGINGVAWGAIIVYGLSGIAYWLYFEYVCRVNIKNGGIRIASLYSTDK